MAYDDNYYPNGVPRQNMDERLPSGDTMYDFLQRMRSQRIDQAPTTTHERQRAKLIPTARNLGVTLPEDQTDIDPRVVRDSRATTGVAPTSDTMSVDQAVSPRIQPRLTAPDMTSAPDSSIQAPQLVLPPDPYGARINEMNTRDRQLSDPTYKGDPNVPGSGFQPVGGNHPSLLGRIGDILREAIVSAGKAYDNGQGTPTERLLGAAGGAIAGGAYGGFHPQAAAERQRLYDINRNRQDMQRVEGLRQNDLQDLKTRTGIADVDVNNKLGLLKINEDSKKEQDNVKLRATHYLLQQGYFDPHNQLHKSAAEQAGLNPEVMKGFDYRNAQLKKIGDTTYKLNRLTGEFEPSGLPKDEAAALVDYTVTNPDTGLRDTFRVPAAKAAQFTTQLSAAGMQISSREKIANMQEAGRNTRNTITNARQAASGLDYIVNQHKLNGSSNAEINQAVTNYLNSLPAEIRPTYKPLPEDQQ